MMTRKLLYVCSLAITIAAGAVHAEETPPAGGDDKVATAQAESDLEALAKKASEACGTTITATIAWDTFAGSPWQKYSMGSYCGAPLEALTRLCGGANAKKYIKKKVKASRCSFGGKDKRAFTFDKGTMELVLDFEAGNYEQFARRSLLGKL